VLSNRSLLEYPIQTASFSKGDISISLVKISYELEDNTVTLSFKDDLPLGEILEILNRYI
jgi:hypothetical protein